MTHTSKYKPLLQNYKKKAKKKSKYSDENQQVILMFIFATDVPGSSSSILLLLQVLPSMEVLIGVGTCNFNADRFGLC